MASIAEAMAVARRHHEAGNLLEAERVYRLILQTAPQRADALHMLGMVTSQLGRPSEAVALMEQALALRPEVPYFHTNLGLVYQGVGNFAGAVAQHDEAIRLDPRFAGAHYNRGTILREQGKLDEALASYEEALRLQPGWPQPLNNLAAVLMDMGLFDEALAAFRRAVELQPASAYAHSNLYYALHFALGDDRAMLAREHQRWYERHGRPLEKLLRPHGNSPDPDRRLRVGYVGTTFHWHPVARFLLPLLESHDHAACEIFCYSSGTARDALTQRLRPHADQWRDVAALSDERLAEVIRADGIDILVDLAAHVGFNRMLVFARKPAPVQVTYLACCSSTGLHTMDYRLSDRFMDPPGAPTTYASEETVWLPETYWCYQPELDLAPGPFPALAAGHVTFGCLNNFSKMTPPIVSAWRELLRTTPGSRLLLHARPGAHRERVQKFFAEGGVDPSRVEFVGLLAPEAYLRNYERIDLGLDTFPYVGGTTTCDALWMGVPVVSLAGAAPQSRGGLSILSTIGLAELVAWSPADYVRVAATLAGDLPRLAVLRAGLRERMRQSPLTNAPRFARHVEAVFRSMWQRWCLKIVKE